MKNSARWPSRTWIAILLLAGHLIFPGIVWTICLLTETPTGDAIDWAGQSPAARAVDALLAAHLLYTLTLVVVMRGWRLKAVGVGFVVFMVSAATNFFAYFSITGIYW